MMKILCFGDSNTWGYSPENGQRLPLHSRWPGGLAKRLGKAFQVIEQGLPGRTSYLNATDFGLCAGIEDLLAKVSHSQPDWLVLMLGTNDLYPAFQQSPGQVADNLNRMICELRAHCHYQQMTAPKILLLSPPAIHKSGRFAQYFRGADEKSRQLPKRYQVLAQSLNCEFMDAATVVKVDPQDGVHLNADAHQALACAVAAQLLRLNEAYHGGR